MKKHLSILITILFLIICCKKRDAQKVDILKRKPKLELNTKTEIKEKIEKNNVLKQFIQNDSLTSALTDELEKFALSDSRFISISKPYQNHHDKSVIDTIETLTFDKTKLELYKAQDREFIIRGIIKNSELEFSDSIKAGVSKLVLEKKLNTKITSNIVVLGNLEQTLLFEFFFENETLKAIEFQGYYD